MAKINLLDQYTINQIAAGEVIERPASVVKELVENAIDAGSNAITVEIKGGGIPFIRVTDNGSGIVKEDVKTAFLRHATSKIREANDLLYVNSLGFRGEALSSIASIAKVELITKTSGDLTGVRYEIHGEEEISFEEIGCPEGTTFLIRDLFFNVPARRKFLKSPSSEASYVETAMQRFALSNPNVAFKFINQGQIKLQTSGNGNLKDVIYHIYGREASMSLIPIEEENDLFKVEGFIGKPEFSRGNRGYETYFVNGRFIKDKTITKGIEEGYKNFTMVHKYPFTVLNFTVDHALLDVNVHPAKLEVRFRQSDELFLFLVQAIRKNLGKQELIPSVSFDKEKKTAPSVWEKKTAEPFEQNRIWKEEKQQDRSEEETTKKQENPYSMKNPEVGEAWIEQAKSFVDIMIGEKKENISDIDTQERTYGIREEEKCPLSVEQKSSTSEFSRLSENISNDMETLGKIEPSIVGNFILQKKEEQVQEKGQSNVVKYPTLQEEPVQNVQEQEEYGTDLVLPEVISTNQEEQKTFLSQVATKSYRLIGQLFKTYWLFEWDNQLFILDQHAGHEKVNYEKFMKEYRNQEIVSQQLAIPILITVSMQEQLLLERYKEYFTKFGFSIEHFGGKEYKVSAVPATLYGMDDKEAFLTLLDNLSSDMEMTDPEKITDRIATMACKASVKGNQKLSFQEVEALMEQLMTLEHPYTCPHGRPTMISMTKSEIEKKFKRIQ